MSAPSPHSLAHMKTLQSAEDQKASASEPARRRRSRSHGTDQSAAPGETARTASLQTVSPICVQVEGVVLDATGGRSEYKGTPRGLEPLIQCLRRYVEAHPDRFVVRDDPTTPGGRIITLVDGVTHS